MEESWAAAELAGAGVYDRRRLTSLGPICERLATHAGKSFSAAVGPATRQAAHDLLAHPWITPAGLLHGHLAQALARCREHAVVLVPHVERDSSRPWMPHLISTSFERAGPSGRKCPTNQPRKGEPSVAALPASSSVNGFSTTATPFVHEVGVKWAAQVGVNGRGRMRAAPRPRAELVIKGLR